MFSFGWWSSGKDRDAVNLFDAVRDAVRQKTIQGRFEYCFISCEAGEGEYADRLAEHCKDFAVPVVFMSASGFRPDLRKKDRETWRDEYHSAVLERLRDFSADIVVLAGYMWIVSADVCNSLPVINLHPAAPGGPAGTWQEVIWQLMKKRADYTGVMMHLVTPELDKGPPVTFCTFPIKGEEWDRLWEQWETDLKHMTAEDIASRYGEEYPLFARIRAEGVRRELPLIVQTLRSMACGDVIIRDGSLFDSRGKELKGPYDLTDAIEGRKKESG